MDGVKWTSPWGEKIRFFTKEAPTPKDVAKARAEIDRNNYFVDGFLEWKAEGQVKKGDWKFSGIRDYEGWEITYKDALLSSVKSPKGNKIEFSYQGKRPLSISQNGEKFIEIKYDGQCVSEITINGIRHSLAYNTGKVVRLPEILLGKSIEFSRPRLSSIKTGDLAPLEFSYDKQSFLSSIKQGDFTEELLVENESEQERKDYFKAEEKRLNARLMGVRAERTKVSGRLIKDANFTYSYPRSGNPGLVTLTNKLNQKAEFDYNVREGSFAVSGFNGIKSTIYYYMRHDVAYHGKVRQVMDALRKSLVKYNYDKDSGKVLNIKDMAENEILFSYNKENELAEVFRRAADASQKEPVLKLDYDKKGNLTEIVRTDATGKAAVTRKIKYNTHNMPVSSSNGQSSNTLEYNGYSYPLSVSDSFKLTKRLEYNRFNQLIASTDAFGVKTQYTFTPAGLISQIERRDGAYVLSSLSIAYNSKGQPVSYTDRQGRVKKFERDAFGRVVKEFFPDESSVEYSYNAAGQLASVFDQNKNEIKFDWDKFGLGSKTTAADQLTDYAYDKFGMLKSVASSQNGKTDRSIKYEYDKLKRVSKITYGTGEVSAFKYDTWGKLIASTSGKKKATFKYDYFGRMIEKTEDGIVNTYTYNEYGQRTSRVTKNGSLTLDEHKTYDKFGRLSQIKSGSKTVTYTYNSKNQLAAQNINGVPVEFSYTKYGQLDSKVLGGKLNPISSLAYSYTKDGMISARLVNGVMQNFEYDAKGQLLKVVDAGGKAVEEYIYDPAGNILKKTVDGKTTTFAYDKANQLASSTLPDGTVKKYVYDAAGRLVTESDAAGAKEYSYGWLDKVTEVIDNGVKTNYSYYTDGQLESVKKGNRESEQMYWDDLALIKRGSTDYIVDPAVTGGNPIMADDKVMFNDLLGNTLGSMSNGKFSGIQRTAFGETTGKVDDNLNFFTGKPEVEGLGYSFLYRNYRPEIGKWQTSDPLGYPDGWNNLAYVNNWVTSCIDIIGNEIYYLAASSAVYGIGHAATIIGNSTVGYNYYSFGSGASSSGESGTGYSTYEEAFNDLQATRDETKGYFDKIEKWTTTQEQDADADCYARNNIDNLYIPGWYDCLTFVYDVLSAAEVDYDRWGQTPNAAYDRNKAYSTVIE